MKVTRKNKNSRSGQLSAVQSVLLYRDSQFLLDDISYSLFEFAEWDIKHFSRQETRRFLLAFYVYPCS